VTEPATHNRAAPPPLDERRAIVAWAFYDWANSAFATTVMAGFFPIFFKNVWSAGVDPTVSTARLGLVNSLAGVTVAILAPVLGAIADRGTARKRFLACFAILGTAATATLALVPGGNWQQAALLYGLGVLGFCGGNVFYDALLTSVASGRRMDMISSLGYALGYLGGGLLFAVNVYMTSYPAAFGLVSAEQAVRVSFASVGVWWALFTLPLLLLVREQHSPQNTTNVGQVVRGGLRQLRETLRDLRQQRTLCLFLLAYWLYIDGVDTIVRMAVDYGMSIGFKSGDLVAALLLTQFVGFPAAIGFGWLGNRIGARRAILLGLGVYLAVSIWGAFMHARHEFYILAGVIGLVQGGVQALSRSFYAKLIPPEKSAEYFGLYNMLGKFAVVLGPVLMGGVGLLVRAGGASADTASRAGIASVALLFAAGGALFWLATRERQG